MPRYHYIVPVPPREPLPGTAGMPLLLARRLGILMQTPVLAPLYSTKPLQPQKELTRAERLANKKDAYACRPGTDLSGKRVLLVDDIITTGATVSACALALQQAGAYEITAAAVAATEELPKSLQKSTEKRKSKKQYDIGIDLGTTSIIIATEEQGVVFRQPTIGAVDTRTNYHHCGGGRSPADGGPCARLHRPWCAPCGTASSRTTA